MRFAIFAVILLVAFSHLAAAKTHFVEKDIRIGKASGRVTPELMFVLSLDAKSEQGALAQIQFLSQNLLMLSENEFVGRRLMGVEKWNSLSKEDQIVVKALVTEAFRVQGLRGLNLYQEGFRDLARMRLEYDYIAPNTRKRIYLLNRIAPEALKLEVKMQTIKSLGVTEKIAQGILTKPMSLEPLFLKSTDLNDGFVFHEIRLLMVPELTKTWYKAGSLPLDVKSTEIQTPHDFTFSLLFIEDADKNILLDDIFVKRIRLMSAVKSELSKSLNNNPDPVNSLKALYENFRQELDSSVKVDQIVERYKRAMNLQ